MRTHEGPALCDWGCALLAAGHRDRALEKFDEAIELYRRVGAGQRSIDCSRPLAKPPRNDKPLGRGSNSQGRELLDSQLRRRNLQTQGFEIAPRDCASDPQPRPSVPRARTGRADIRISLIAQHFDENVGAAVSTDLGDAGVVLDAQAVTEYRRRLEDLRPELEEAQRCNDLGPVSLLREEAEVLTAELTAGVGFQGRERRTSSHSERARLSVFKNIRGAIEKIREANPALGRHLCEFDQDRLPLFVLTRPSARRLALLIPHASRSSPQLLPVQRNFPLIFTPSSLKVQ